MAFNRDHTTNLQKGQLVHTDEHRERMIKQDRTDEIQIQCFPLYSILLALNRTKIDLFSLDIEGDELKVLKTVPFEKVDITVMIVDFFHQITKGAELITFLKGKGYQKVLNSYMDMIFKKTNALHAGEKDK